MDIISYLCIELKNKHDMNEFQTLVKENGTQKYKVTFENGETKIMRSTTTIVGLFAIIPHMHESMGIYCAVIRKYV